MYTRSEDWDVEAICYEEAHIQSVLEVIRKNFDKYFDSFVETQAGAGISADDFSKLQNKFGVQRSHASSAPGNTANYKAVIAAAIDEFENDRQNYIDIFDAESLEEYVEDPGTFKSIVLKNRCPIIRKTLANRQATELDKYRRDFNLADANGLLEVVTRLSEFEENYNNNVYNAATFEDAKSYEDFDFSLLDTEEYTYFGVIGGGIKTMLLHKVNPKIFPSRSRNALWALWFLSDRKHFGCKTDSEFVMIDTQKNITQQNYFYPYELFNFYAFEVYKMLRDKATELNAYIDPDYRYVIVDVFFDYVAGKFEEAINFLSSQIRDDGGFSYV